MNEIVEIMEFVGTTVWQVWPLFLISILFSVLIRALKLDGIIRRAFSANIGVAILLATLVGAFSPFCSCTVVPVIAGLLLSGVPLAPIMSFWIASPTMDPEIFTLSVGVIGWPLALARLLSTLALSLAAGYITLFLTNSTGLRRLLPRRLARQAVVVSPSSVAAMPLPVTNLTAGMTTSGLLSNTSPAATLGSGSVKPKEQGMEWREQLVTSFKRINWPDFGRDVGRQSWMIGRWLLLAFLLEALITIYVPQTAIATILGKDNPLAVPLAALIGIPLYLSNYAALPIVSGLLEQGMQPGAAIAFLIAGPVTTVPAMTAVYGLVQKRIFVLYLGVGLLGATILGLITNVFLG